MKVPSPGRVPTTELAWPHASRLAPARFQALDCFERLLDPGAQETGEVLARLSTLTSASGAGDLSLLDPSRVVFGTGAGWIMPSFTLPREGRFSTHRRGAFHVAGDIATAIEEVRHHVILQYRQEGITLPMDLDYRALALQIQGRLHDIRGKAMARSPWSAIYAPDSYASSQAFADALVQAGSRGLVYGSVRHPGGACAALFDPNLARVCRHDTYLAFRWDGRTVSRVVEKRILRLA